MTTPASTDLRRLQASWDEETLSLIAVRRARRAMAGFPVRSRTGQGRLLRLVAAMLG